MVFISKAHLIPNRSHHFKRKGHCSGRWDKVSGIKSVQGVISFDIEGSTDTRAMLASPIPRASFDKREKAGRANTGPRYQFKCAILLILLNIDNKKFCEELTVFKPKLS
jgi:hypothetical protein